jgi:hypothetical protein
VKSNDLVRTIDIKDRTGRIIGQKEVVTYQGLLTKAHEEGLVRVATKLVQVPSDENGRTAIAKALVETTKGHFEALGDASPENVNSFIVPHLIRMAETRAKARALRDAVNVGVISFEELEEAGLNGPDLGSSTQSALPPTEDRRPSTRPTASKSDSVPMTEAQRRYLFRILAGRGLETDAAHEYLKKTFGVPTLKEVTKADASAVIDELLKHPEEAKADGLPQR